MYSGSMGGGTPRKHKLGGSTAFLARPRLGALKNYYFGSKYSKPMGSYGFDKKKKIKKPTIPRMEYRKKPDFADTAYREAVSRLRILLAESYTPIKRTTRELDSAGEETDNQSLLSGVSRASRYPHYHGSFLPKKYNYYAPKMVSHYLSDDKVDSHKVDAPPELMTFIERQEDYIEQLERESRFCKEELSSLLNKVKDVIAENETLHEKQKNNIMKSVFDQFETETETETDMDRLKTFHSPKKLKKQRILEGPAIVFESRISELEAHLTQSKIDLKKAQEENDNLRKKLGDDVNVEGFESSKKQFETLQRDKVILQETVTKLQAALNLLRDKEYNTNDQVKRSLDVAEQAQYEKTAAEHEIRRLKDELERQHGKLREAISEQSRRVADERSAVERRYTQQIEQLTAELGVHWEQSSKLQLEVDKQRRENADLRREIAQRQAQIDELKKEMQNKIITLQSDIGVSGAEKSALEQQISTLQMANERCERQSKQEASRLQVEMQSLRQRLDRADADLIHSRRENIRLTEQIAALEKEINMNKALADEKSKKPSNEIIALPPPKESKDNDMSAMIKDMESKHVATVAELEGMIQSQNQLMDKLSSECHALTQKLDESSSRHKLDRRRLRGENERLIGRLEHLWTALKQLQHDTNREEIRELQTNLDYLTNRFSQSQIKPTVDEEQRNRLMRNSQHEPEKTAPNVSRTSSKSSLNPQPNESVPVPQPEQPVNNAEPQPIMTEVQEYAGETQQYPNEPPQNISEQITNEPSQEYPADYAADPNQGYNQEQYADPNVYADQQYDPNQQYMSQEQYDQQYGQYDPNSYPQNYEGGEQQPITEPAATEDSK